MDGPDYTVLNVERMTSGQVRVLVRKRGGRLIRFCVAASAADGITITRMIEQVLPTWPVFPPARLMEE